MAFKRKIIVPKIRRRLGDYLRPCDRCGWEGWARSDLVREERTLLLVCKYCVDKLKEPVDAGKVDFTDGKQILD